VRYIGWGLAGAVYVALIAAVSPFLWGFYLLGVATKLVIALHQMGLL
jgi:hypothetical protein